MGRIFILLIFTTFTFILNAQSERSWNQGKLNWDDFPIVIGEELDSQFAYYISSKDSRKKVGDVKVYRYTTTCFINHELTWANQDSRSDLNLRYFQLIFDIVEYHRRLLQVRLDHIIRSRDLSFEMNSVNNQCNEEINKLAEASSGGTNEAVLSEWEEKLSFKLAKNKEDEIPVYTKGNFKIGMHLLVGFNSFSGFAGDILRPGFSGVYGFDIFYKRSRLILAGNAGFNKIKSDYFENYAVPKNSKVNLIHLYAAYGYDFQLSPKITITPFVGYGTSELVKYDDENSENGPIFKKLDSSFSGGINLEFVFYKYLSLVPDPIFKWREYDEFYVNSRIYISKTDFADDFSGLSINLAVGISFSGRFLKMN